MNEAIKNIPICIIGAGAIVKEAHLPAYALAGFTVKGITNRNITKANDLAQQFNIPNVYGSLDEMIDANENNIVYDFALPASEIVSVLEKLPQGATVLIQKPMGENMAEAKAILELTQQKQMLAGVNFQMRFAPFVQEARRMIRDGEIGVVADVEVYVNVYTPWNLWNFLSDKPRMEINYHSIHYVDLIRSLLGEPRKIYARTFKHPGSMQLASVRSNIIMDYGDALRAAVHTNHNHDFGYTHQQSYIKIEGTKGAIKVSFGALIDYPRGVPDRFEYIIHNEKEKPMWHNKHVEGSWFPHAFIGTMEQILLAKAGIIEKPENSVDDAFETMRCVEAAYISSESGGIHLSDVFS